MNLIAAGRASRRWRARHTSPMPPRPIRRLQLVAAHAAGLGDVEAEAVDGPRAEVGDEHCQGGAEDGREVVAGPDGQAAEGAEQREDQRLGRRGEDGGDQGLPRRAGQDHREEDDEGRHPGQEGQRTDGLVGGEVSADRDQRAEQDLEAKAELDEPWRADAAHAREHEDGEGGSEAERGAELAMRPGGVWPDAALGRRRARSISIWRRSAPVATSTSMAMMRSRPRDFSRSSGGRPRLGVGWQPQSKGQNSVC